MWRKRNDNNNMQKWKWTQNEQQKPHKNKHSNTPHVKPSSASATWSWCSLHPAPSPDDSIAQIWANHPTRSRLKRPPSPSLLMADGSSSGMDVPSRWCDCRGSVVSPVRRSWVCCFSISGAVTFSSCWNNGILHGFVFFFQRRERESWFFTFTLLVFESRVEEWVRVEMHASEFRALLF